MHFYLCFDERMNLWWTVSLQQRENGKCAKVNGHCHCDCLSPVIREEFRKGQCILGQEGFTDGEGDELHLLSSVLGRPFAGKLCFWHGLWEQHRRELLGGSVGCATLQPREAWCMQTAFLCPQVIQCLCQKPRHRGSRNRAEVKERAGVGT